MTISAGKSALSALVFATFLSPIGANAQEAKPSTDRPRTVTASSVAATPAANKEATAQQAPQQKPPDSASASKASAAEAAVEALAPLAVVPPAPNVIKRNPNTISIPPRALDAATDYEEKPTASVSVGSRFGVRRDPFTRRHKFHSGVDIKAHWGDAVGASYPGTISFVGWYHGYGNMVIVDHGGGVATHYAHLSSFDVEVGEHVERGTIIGRAGSTGRATSAHLHYEVRIEGNAINPFQTVALEADSPYFKQSKSVATQSKPKETVQPPGAEKPRETSPSTAAEKPKTQN